MTTTTAEEVRRRGGAPRKPRTVASLGVELFDSSIEEWRPSVPTWPSAKYRDNPVLFFREVLGVEPWRKQIEVIEAIRSHKRVAVRSGHKVSKSHTAAGIALWFFASFEDARVVMTSTTSRQVDQILWRELKMMHARSGRCVSCKLADAHKAERGERPGPRPCAHSALLDGQGELPELARTGLKTDDFREIVGFTARESEAVAGVSGKNLLYLVDEASGVPDIIFEAIEGNRAGGGRVVLFGNPTRNEGEHYEAFEGAKRDAYHQITISSEETPNAVSGDELVPGLATREWVEEREREWGRESALFIIRVLGRHALKDEGRVVSVHLLKEAEERWAALKDNDGRVESLPTDGRLIIGLDPAGPGLFGDETAFAPRRGSKVLAVRSRPGLDDDAIVANVVGTIREFAPSPLLEPALPMVVIDKGGAVGSRVYGRLRAYADANAGVFVVVGVDASRKAERDAALYELVRDELWARAAIWLKDGAIPADVKLSKDLNAPEWEGRTGSQKLRVTSKEDLRKKLGRSPDRGDAVCLAVWDPTDLAEHVEAQMRDRAAAAAVPERAAVMNPYDGGALDPYGGGLR